MRKRNETVKIIIVVFIIILVSLILNSCSNTEEPIDCNCGVVKSVRGAFNQQVGKYEILTIKSDCGNTYTVNSYSGNNKVGVIYCEY